MAGRIPPEFIDQLLDRVDIVDVIDKRVPLKKAGAEFQALCPFHSEKTPSFTVSPTKQFFHCFGCGAHGTAIGFLMDHDHLSFPEAIEELARDAGMEVPHEQEREKGPDLGPLYGILERADRFYREQLRAHPKASTAVEYLRNRGVSGEIARDFGIGYAPPGWDNLVGKLGQDSRSHDLLRQTGLTNEKAEGGRGAYDRFRDRIIFPIRDARGRTIGFGGRVLGDDEPKYLNSPETPVFHKGRELYGLFEARTALRDIASLIVVEGYMDVVALAQAGIRNCVATLGTATTTEHLNRLFRLTTEVAFCFDGDRAGRDAAWKALNVALPLLDGSREVRFLFLPEGEDPDSMVRKAGPSGFNDKLEGAVTTSEFIESKLREQVQFSRDVNGPARLAEAARPLLEKIPQGAFRELVSRRLVDVTGVTDLLKTAGPPAPGRYTGKSATLPPSAVRTAIRLLIDDPYIATRIQVADGWQQLDLPGVSLLAELVVTAREQPEIGPAALIERQFGTPAWEQLKKLSATPIDTPAEGRDDEFAGALGQLLQRRNESEGEILTSKDLSELSPSEKQRLRELFASRGSS